MFGQFTLKIRGQLLLVMILTTMVAVSVGVMYESARHTQSLRQWATQEVTSVADAMAQDFLKLIVLGDPDGAANLVERLASFPLIQKVELYNTDGQALFQYQRDAEGDAADLENDRFMVSREIRAQDSVYGRVDLTASGAKLRSDLSEYYQYLAILFAILLVISAASAWFFQRFFSGPLLQLTRFMHRVGKERDFSLRARTPRRDEFGVVFGGLNELLEETQSAQRQLVAEYTAKEDALRAKLSAESANREKSAFLANMSHELRTPLNAIIGYSELLDEDAAASGDTGASADLKKIRTAAKHLLSLINDVLDLSKIEAGKMKLEVGRVNVAGVVNDVLSMVQPLVDRGENQLRKDIRVGDLVLEADEVRLRQILFNLLSNACKFTQRGTITMTVTLADSQPGRVHFSVRDTGAGMKPEDLHTLFQPFVQAESVGKKHEGTGLGLALSRRFCEMMGGQIQATSVYGQGSEFSFWLPLDAPRRA